VSARELKASREINFLFLGRPAVAACVKHKKKKKKEDKERS
jgi:hypothetical protein